MNDEPELRMPQFRIIFQSDVTSFTHKHTVTHIYTHVRELSRYMYSIIPLATFHSIPLAIFYLTFNCIFK